MLFFFLNLFFKEDLEAEHQRKEHFVSIPKPTPTQSPSPSPSPFPEKSPVLPASTSSPSTTQVTFSPKVKAQTREKPPSELKPAKRNIGVYCCEGGCFVKLFARRLIARQWLPVKEALQVEKEPARAEFAARIEETGVYWLKIGMAFNKPIPAGTHKNQQLYAQQGFQVEFSIVYFFCSKS